MHDHDFAVLEKAEKDDGTVDFIVDIKAMQLSRRYRYDPATDSVQLRDKPILVAGHDMTSITGKRVREWLRSAGYLP